MNKDMVAKIHIHKGYSTEMRARSYYTNAHKNLRTYHLNTYGSRKVISARPLQILALTVLLITPGTNWMILFIHKIIPKKIWVNKQ